MSSKPIPGRADSHPRCVQMYGKVLAKWAPHKVKGDSRACPHDACGRGNGGTTCGLGKSNKAAKAFDKLVDDVPLESYSSFEKTARCVSRAHCPARRTSHAARRRPAGARR